MELLIKPINKKMKKLLFVLAVALSACGGGSVKEVSSDSTSVTIDTLKLDSVKAIDTTIIDTLKK
jgi:hypothetical protein